MLALKQSVYDTVRNQGIRFPYILQVAGKDIPCSATVLPWLISCSVEQMSGLTSRLASSRTTFDVKKCDLTVQGNINYFSSLDVQLEMEMGLVTN